MRNLKVQATKIDSLIEHKYFNIYYQVNNNNKHRLLLELTFVYVKFWRKIKWELKQLSGKNYITIQSL